MRFAAMLEGTPINATGRFQTANGSYHFVELEPFRLN